MHLQPVFGGKSSSSKQKSVRSKQRYPARVVGGTIAEYLFNRGLCLPSGTTMTETDLEGVVDTILKCTPHANDRV
jgi:dTDP-4-amino-4,6-dideoxygalactose transaminase